MHHSSFLIKRSNVFYYALCIVNCALLISCHRNYPKEENKIPDPKVNEHLMNANKIIVQDESKDIDEFIKRHQWKMNTSGTGLRMEVYEEGTGKQPELK